MPLGDSVVLSNYDNDLDDASPLLTRLLRIDFSDRSPSILAVLHNDLQHVSAGNGERPPVSIGIRLIP